MPGLLDWLGLGQQGTDATAGGTLAQRMAFDPSTITGGLLGAMAAPQTAAAPASVPSMVGAPMPFFGAKPQGFASLTPSADMPAPNATPTSGTGTPGIDWSDYAGKGIDMSGVPAAVAPNLQRFFADNPATVSVDKSAPGGLSVSYDDPKGAAWATANAGKYGITLDPNNPGAIRFGGAVAPSIAPNLGMTSASAPVDIRPQAQVGPTPAAPADPPGFMDRLGTAMNSLGNVYGHGGPFDALINLGVGMSSGPGGMARALQMTQNGQVSLANQAQAQGQLALQLAKLKQEQSTQAGAASFIKAQYAAKGTPISDEQALALAGNSGAVSTAVSNTIKTPDQEKADKAQLVTVKNPDGTETQQWMTPGSATGTPIGPAAAPKPPDAVRDVQTAMQNWQQFRLPDPNDPKNAGFWQDFTRQRLAGSGGVSVTMPPVEKASDAAFGKAEGEHWGAIMKAGDDARQAQGQLAFMNDAFRQGGSNITTGPAAKAVLAGKQLIQGLTGIDLGGIPESEAVNKLGFGLATSLVQDISKRGGTQAEFIRSLQNVPGIFMSPAGSRVMMSILGQQNQARVDLGDMVQDPANRRDWSQAVNNYYAAHPLISPFTGRPLSNGDVTSLRAAATQAGIDPVTGQPSGGGGGASSVSPGWSFIPGN